jgi:thioester reductase-like protein
MNSDPQSQSILAELAALPMAARRARLCDLVKTEVGSILDIDPDFIDEDQSLPDLGADSLRLVALAGRLKPIIGFTVPPNVLPLDASIGDLVTLFASVLAEPDPLAALRQSQRVQLASAIAADLYLDEAPPAALPPVTPAEAREPKHIFLTGASGFLGAYLVRALADETAAQIHCHVRARSAEDGLFRIKANLEKFGLWTDSLPARIVAEPGDLSKPLLGLSPERFSWLAQHIDIIHHNGADVHLTKPYAQLRAANVGGTRTVLQLATSGRVKPVTVISSVGLFDTPELHALSEIDEAVSAKDVALLPNGYSQAKWAGEQLTRLAQARGLPAAILRVGHVIGAGVSADLAGRVNLSCFISGIVPDIANPIDFVTPGYAASVIVALPRRLEQFLGVYHVVNPRPLMPADVAELVPSLPFPMEITSIERWLSEIRMAALRDPTHPLFAAADLLGDPDRPDESTFVQTVLRRPRITTERVIKAVPKQVEACPPARDILAAVVRETPEFQFAFGEVTAAE